MRLPRPGNRRPGTARRLATCAESRTPSTMPDVAREGFYGDEVSGVGALLDLIANRPSWHAEAACRGASPDVDFFPASSAEAGRAKKVCAGCPVLSECRQWSLEQPSTLEGVWGGLTRQGRALLRRRYYAA
jgi:WhiB family transcriptional regulator, redox-sensing transcriptional regulator